MMVGLTRDELLALIATRADDLAQSVRRTRLLSSKPEVTDADVDESVRRMATLVACLLERAREDALVATANGAS